MKAYDDYRPAGVLIRELEEQGRLIRSRADWENYHAQKRPPDRQPDRPATVPHPPQAELRSAGD